MTLSLHVERTARKTHACGWACGVPIEPGTRYVRSSLPPRTDPNDSDHWWTQALHGHRMTDCPHQHMVVSPAFGRHQARCSCGWRAEERTSEQLAVRDVEAHVALNDRSVVAS
jgi:hypothetical protein